MALESLVAPYFMCKVGGDIQTVHENVASLNKVGCKSKHNQELVVLLNVLFIDRLVYLTNKLIP